MTNNSSHYNLYAGSIIAPIRRGVRQGAVSSPNDFIACIDGQIIELKVTCCIGVFKYSRRLSCAKNLLMVVLKQHAAEVLPLKFFFFSRLQKAILNEEQ